MTTQVRKMNRIACIWAKGIEKKRKSDRSVTPISKHITFRLLSAVFLFRASVDCVSVEAISPRHSIKRDQLGKYDKIGVGVSNVPCECVFRVLVVSFRWKCPLPNCPVCCCVSSSPLMVKLSPTFHCQVFTRLHICTEALLDTEVEF